MSPKKISARALLLLRVIDKHSDVDWTTGEVRRHFYPPALGGGRTAYIDRWPSDPDAFDGAVLFYGQGDIAAMRSLVRRGLAVESRTMALAFAPTEDGRVLLEAERAKGG